MKIEVDKARLLRGEHCSCDSHRLIISGDWYVNCKDCGDEWSAAELLVAEIKRLNEINISNGKTIIRSALKLEAAQKKIAKLAGLLKRVEPSAETRELYSDITKVLYTLGE